MRLEVFMGVEVEIIICVMTCNPVNNSQCFGGTCYICLLL
jgi:hypothetical protein